MFIILMGVSGWGKTTVGKKLANALDLPYYEGDAFHPQENVEKMASGIPLTDEDRAGWLEKLSELIHARLQEGASGILSCSALKEKYREMLRVYQDQVRFIYLKGTYQLILTRMEDRKGHYMPSDLLKSQFDALEEPENVLTIDIDQSPDAIVEEALKYLHQIGFTEGHDQRK